MIGRLDSAIPKEGVIHGREAKGSGASSKPGEFGELLRSANREISAEPRAPGKGESVPGPKGLSTTRARPENVPVSTPVESPEVGGPGHQQAGRARVGGEGPTGNAPVSADLSTAFVKTRDTRFSYLVRFAQVPDFAKSPLGPYRQAPPEFGGDWWQVNPFTGPEPWRNLDPPSIEEMFPEGFIEVFGPPPKPSDFDSNWDYRVARTVWSQELKYFGGTGMPEGVDPAKLEEAAKTFEDWGLGRPVFFQDRYGWRARFPDSEIPTFGGSPATAAEAPHVLVANYQIELLQKGITPSRLHPWLPDQLLPEDQSEAVS
jgi:hypothetical protein